MVIKNQFKKIIKTGLFIMTCIFNGELQDYSEVLINIAMRSNRMIIPSSLILHVAAKETVKDDNSGNQEIKEEVIEAAVTKDSSSKTGENVANPAHTEKLDTAAKEAEKGKI